MITGVPKEREWVSWLYVVSWAAVIYLTIPFARPVQKFVSENWDRNLFGYTVIAVTTIVVVIAIRYVFGLRRPTRGGYFWLLAVAAVQIRYTVELMKNSPEEAIHFLQYGFLGILIFRALSHRTRDVTIYLSAAAIGGIAGIVDEGIQWATPDRYWAMGDIWLNFLGAALVQIAIAGGIRPSFISENVTPPSVRRLCRFTSLAVVILGVSMLNTPAWIAWYSERVPFLNFLTENESVMFEYGFRYDDPEIGLFHSRLAPEELALADTERSQEAARLLDQYRPDSTYLEYLRHYTPVSDPFLHEARVHLFRRDRYLAGLAESEIEDEEYRWRQIVVYRENQIMEKYFPNTLRSSSYVLPPELLASLAKPPVLDEEYMSAVSKHLIARFSERQVLGAMILLILAIEGVSRWYGKRGVAYSSRDVQSWDGLRVPRIRSKGTR